MSLLRHKLPMSAWLLIACGAWLVGLGTYFIALRPPLLPEDLRYMGGNSEEIRAALPGLTGWLKKVFTVMGGFMAGCGVLTGYVGATAMQRTSKATSWTLFVVGAVTVGLMSAINFALKSDFRWLLLVPPLLWTAGLVSYLAPRLEITVKR